jgi:hypothetical protein
MYQFQNIVGESPPGNAHMAVQVLATLPKATAHAAQAHSRLM